MRKQKVHTDSPGEAKVLWTNTDGGALRLSNFGIGKHDLKPEHNAYLRLYVVPVLAAGGSALVMGLTSRSGSPVINRKLSERRTAAVIGQLQWELGFIPVVAQELCFGEAAATLAGAPDGWEHPNWRGSIVIYSKQKTPPKRPPHIPRLPTMVIRHSQKSVVFPGSLLSGGDPAIFLGKTLITVLTTESRVIADDSHRVLVPDTAQITRIDLSTEGSGQAMTTEILKFTWGPQKKPVEVWSKTEGLKARVMTARAMQIYEEPGAYLLMSSGW